MKKYFKIIFFFVEFLVCINSLVLASDLSLPNIEFNANDRIIIFAPHPDDELLGCAGVIQKAKAKGLPVKIVFFTYGDNNEWAFMLYRKHFVIIPKAVQNMGLIRHDEAIKGLEVLGIPKEDAVFLGYPDFKTLNIWYANWEDNPPARSMLTRVTSVPYKNGFRYKAPYKGEEILKDLETILEDFKPTKIFVSHPADRNVDHRSLYLFVRVAVWNLNEELKCEIFPYLIHFNKWPRPLGCLPYSSITPPVFLEDYISWFNSSLNDEEVSNKYEAIKVHQSQFKLEKRSLLSFVRSNEIFGDFKEINITANSDIEKIYSDNIKEFDDTEAELADIQRASFVGNEERFVQISNEDILFSYKFSRPLGEKTDIYLRIFGYRHDKPFEKMPKLLIKTRGAKVHIFDKNHRVTIKNVKAIRESSQITISIPLKALGSPDKILTSSQCYLMQLPIDWFSWRLINLSKNEQI